MSKCDSCSNKGKAYIHIRMNLPSQANALEAQINNLDRKVYDNYPQCPVSITYSLDGTEAIAEICRPEMLQINEINAPGAVEKNVFTREQAVAYIAANKEKWYTSEE